MKFVFVFTEEYANAISLFVFPNNPKRCKESFTFGKFEEFDTVKVMKAIEDILSKDYKIKKHNEKWFGWHEIAKAFSIEL